MNLNIRNGLLIIKHFCLFISGFINQLIAYVCEVRFSRRELSMNLSNNKNSVKELIPP